jgi:ABC-2 type transport system ATP-binding protein
VFRKRGGLGRRNITEQWALKGVSFDVRTCESYALLGPNGSGKSTLIRILSTLLLHDEGTVEIESLCLPEQEARVREIVGRVSVDAAFYKKMSAKENLLYSAFMYGHRARSAEERAREILGELGFPAARFNDPLEEMSRGMQQKVAITRALLINPPVLLLDEPTTGLDPASKRDVQRFLERLRKQHGTTILLTSHDMGEAERLCERIGLLADGRLVAEGTADELRRKANKENLDDVFIRLTGERLVDDGKETTGVTP